MKTKIVEPKKEQRSFTLWTRETDKKILKVLAWFGKGIIVLILLTAAILLIKNEILYGLYSANESFFDSTGSSADNESQPKDECNVRGIVLHGELVNYIAPENLDEHGDVAVDQSASEDIVFYIESAEADDQAKGILLQIDSPGGSPLAGEEIAAALKRATKPTVALIRGIGTSAAYWAATGADVIFASKASDVGGLGVTMSYLDASRQNQAEGLVYNQLSSGIFKDSGNPDKTLLPEEKELFMRDVEILHRYFVEQVAENRGLDIEKVTALADGSSMLGQMALEQGLIDRLGSFTEVEDYLKEQVVSEIKVCW